MRHKDKVDGVVVEIDDGDESTEYITELHGKLAEEADDELVEFAMKILRDRGYEIKKV
jgi:hypothetical protein